MFKENDNSSEYFRSYKDKKYILDEQDIEKNYRNIIRKSFDIRNFAKNNLSKCIF